MTVCENFYAVQSPARPQRAVLTLALGKPLYLEMAFNLARSFFWWHRGSDIPFFLATDHAEPPPPDLAGIRIIPVTPRQYGEGFSPKLYLDALAPADRTLFIDADCLCVGNLDGVFARFEGRAVSVIGGKISEGEWFGDVEPLCRRLGVKSLPKFNGGIYYLESGEVSRQVYVQARNLEKEYDALGLVRLRGRPNDELLMAMAMATHGLDAIPDDGTILADPFACPGPLSLDVINGGARLTNPPAPHPLHREWYPFTQVSPLIVHFLGDAHETYQYRAEALRLRFAARHLLARMRGAIYIVLGIRLPGWGWAVLKPRLRGIYRAIFGVRAVGASKRL